MQGGAGGLHQGVSTVYLRWTPVSLAVYQRYQLCSCGLAYSIQLCRQPQRRPKHDSDLSKMSRFVWTRLRDTCRYFRAPVAPVASVARQGTKGHGSRATSDVACSFDIPLKMISRSQHHIFQFLMRLFCHFSTVLHDIYIMCAKTLTANSFLTLNYIHAKL